MKGITLTCLVAAAAFGAAWGRDVPDFLRICNRNNPNIGECIKDSVENLRPYLVSGVPDYSIPSLEPLVLKELVSTSGGNIKLKLRNILVHGASNFAVQKLKATGIVQLSRTSMKVKLKARTVELTSNRRINFGEAFDIANANTLRFVIEVSFTKLSIEGDYDVDGKVILLRLQGSGPMTGNFTNCRGLVKLRAERMPGKDGQIYLKVVDFKTKISVGQGQLKLNNLFGGDPVLGEAINMAINSNFDSFIKELQPSIESALSDTFLKIANSILTQFTYDSIFPLS